MSCDHGPYSSGGHLQLKAQATPDMAAFLVIGTCDQPNFMEIVLAECFVDQKPSGSMDDAASPRRATEHGA